MLSPQELAEYARVMRENGIVSFKHDGNEIVIIPHYVAPGEQKPLPEQRVYSDEELRFAATEGLPD